MKPTFYFSVVASFLLSIPAKSQLYYDAGWTDHGTKEVSAFGWTMSNVGDVNGDGYVDFLCGGPGWTDTVLEQGRVSLYYGGPSGISAEPAWSYSSGIEHGEVGFSSDGGDLNGDGYSDIVIGCLEWPGTFLQQGKSVLFYGGPSGPAAVPDWEWTSAQFLALVGSSVALSGDVNNDGYNDMFVSAKMWDNGQTDEGKVWMFYGSASGPVGPVWSWESNQNFAIGGFPVNYAGDINADGYSDVIIGANMYDNGMIDNGLAVCFYGSSTGLAATPDWSQSSTQKKCNFGHWVDGAGDVNGDGYDDVIISSLLYTNGEFHEGRAWVYNGSASGLSHTPSWTSESNMVEAQFGYCVAGAGDIDNDGYDDVIVGAKYWANPEIDEGACFVYFGSPTGLETDYCWKDESNQDSAYYGRMVGGEADFNNDGYGDFFASAYRYTDSIYQDGKGFLFYGKPREDAFHYSAPSYSTTDADPTPVIDGLAGGTFAASAGLVINTTTGTIDVSASTPGGPYTVTYTVIATCTLSKSVQVSVTSGCSAPTGLHVSGVTSTTATLTWSPVAGATVYKVFVKKTGGSTQSFNTFATSYNFTTLEPSSSYKTWVMTKCGASSSPNSVKKNIVTPAGRILAEGINDVNVFPNPASTFLHVIIPKTGTDCRISLLDMNGKTILIKNESGGGIINSDLDISIFPDGIYMLQVVTGEKNYPKEIVISR